MTFTHLGKAIAGAGDLAYRGITKVHDVTDATLEKTGLGMLVPPIVHELGDATFDLTRRSVRGLGQTAGGVLESFDHQPLHHHDKSIGGNWKPDPASEPKKSKKGSKKAKKAKKESGDKSAKVKLCKNCHERPRVADFKYCSKKCTVEAEKSDSDHD